MGTFEIYVSAGQYRWRLKAPNGEIIAQGEAYRTRQGVESGIAAVARYAPSARVVALA